MSTKQEKKMTKQDFALKYESGEFDNEETPQRVQKELDNRSRALFGMKTPKNIQSQKRIKVQASAKVFSDTSKSDDEILKKVLMNIEFNQMHFVENILNDKDNIFSKKYLIKLYIHQNLFQDFIVGF